MHSGEFYHGNNGDHPRKNDEGILSVALGAGGPFAIAYDSGICVGLGQKGIDVRKASGFIGTSGGAWVEGFIVTEMTDEEVESIPKISFPNRKHGYLQKIGRDVFDDARSPLVQTATVRLPSRRHLLPSVEILSGDKHDLADIIPASSAIPIGYRPVRVNDERYVDGGVRSFTHANRAVGAQNLLVVAALAKHFRLSVGPLRNLSVGRTLETMANHEMNQWEKQHRGQAHLIRPNRAIGGLVERFSDLFDKKIARRAYDMAIEQSHQLVENRQDLATLALRMSD